MATSGTLEKSNMEDFVGSGYFVFSSNILFELKCMSEISISPMH